MTLKLDFKSTGDMENDVHVLRTQHGLSLERATDIAHALAQSRVTDLRAHKPNASQAMDQATLLSSLTQKYLDAGLAYDDATAKAYEASKSPEGARMLSSSQLTGPPTSGMAGYGPNTSTPGSAKRDAEALSSLGTKLSAKAISDFVKSQASIDDVSTVLEAVGSRLDQLAVSQPDAVKAIREQWAKEAGFPASPMVSAMKQLGPNSLLFNGKVYRARRAPSAA